MCFQPVESIVCSIVLSKSVSNFILLSVSTLHFNIIVFSSPSSKLLILKYSVSVKT